MSINFLLLSLTILSTLFLHLIIKTEKHLVTVFLVLDLLLLDHFGVFELEQLILVLVQISHPLFLLIELCLVSLAHFDDLVVKPIEISIMWLRLPETVLPHSLGCEYLHLKTKGNSFTPPTYLSFNWFYSSANSRSICLSFLLYLSIVSVFSSICFCNVLVIFIMSSSCLLILSLVLLTSFCRFSNRMVLSLRRMFNEVISL